MNADDLENVLINDYIGYFEVRELPPTNNYLNPFLNIATERIEDLLSGGYELDEAYEIYQKEIVSDIEYVMKKVQ